MRAEEHCLDPDALCDLQATGDRRKGWHGSKIEAIYKILFEGKPSPSTDKELGHRMHENAPGVYVHEDKNSQKAGYYMKCVPLKSNGIFWAVMIELQCNRDKKVKAQRYTDQWIQQPDSTELVALWFRRHNVTTLPQGECLAPKWEPKHEANPRNKQVKKTNKETQEKIDKMDEEKAAM